MPANKVFFIIALKTNSGWPDRTTIESAVKPRVTALPEKQGQIDRAEAIAAVVGVQSPRKTRTE